MRALETLFELIKSLKKSEKRHFKVLAQRVGDQKKQYLTLYKVLVNSKKYDLKQFEKKLAEQDVNHLHVKIPYLQDLLVQSLILQYEDSNTNSILDNLLANARLMEQRGLLEEQQKILRKAKKIAKKYELLPTLLSILDQQIEYILNRGKRVKREVLPILNERKILLDKIQINGEYQRLLFGIFLLFKIGGQIEPEDQIDSITDIVNHDLLNEGKQLDSFYAQVHYHFSWALLDRVYNPNLDRVNQHYQQLIDVWNKPEYAHMRENDYKTYRNQLSNYLGSCHDIERYDLVPDRLEELERYVDLSIKEDEIWSFTHIVYLKFFYLINTAKFEEAKVMTSEIEAGLSGYKEKIILSRVITFYCNLAVAYFALKDYNAVIQLINKVKDLKYLQQRQDLQVFMSLFDLMTTYEEIGANDLLENRLRRAERESKKKGDMTKSERLIYRLFRKLLNILESDKKSFFQEIHLELENLQKNEPRQIIRGAIEIKLWLEAKIEGVSFRKLLENNEKKRQEQFRENSGTSKKD